MIGRSVVILAILGVLAGLAQAAEPAAVGTPPVVATQAGAPTQPPRATQSGPNAQGGQAVVAQDSSCANACQTQHDQCRVSTKGSPSCDSARQRCLQACIANKRK